MLENGCRTKTRLRKGASTGTYIAFGNEASLKWTCFDEAGWWKERQVGKRSSYGSGDGERSDDQRKLAFTS